MRGRPDRQATMLCFITSEHRVPQGHPIRRIKALADQELKRLSPVFAQMYSKTGRPSIPPETLWKSLLLIALSFANNLLFRWFLDLDMMAESFDATVFTKNIYGGRDAH